MVCVGIDVAKDMVKDPCGSVSTSRTFLPSIASPDVYKRQHIPFVQIRNIGHGYLWRQGTLLHDNHITGKFIFNALVNTPQVDPILVLSLIHI